MVKVTPEYFDMKIRKQLNAAAYPTAEATFWLINKVVVGKTVRKSIVEPLEYYVDPFYAPKIQVYVKGYDDIKKEFAAGNITFGCDVFHDIEHDEHLITNADEEPDPAVWSYVGTVESYLS